MANAKQLARLMKGIETWNKWRERNFGVHIDLRGADLMRINLSPALLSETKSTETFRSPMHGLIIKNVKEANLRVYWRALLNEADFSGANLRRANLSEAYLTGANLSEADLREANLRAADLSGADLRGAKLRGAKLYSTNLRKANLSGTELFGIKQAGADFRGADLSGANLIGANLSGAFFNGANLSRANLQAAELISTHLAGVNLSEADLFEVELRGTNLIGGNFSKAKAGYIIFRDTDLSEAIGLEDVVHVGPSSISTDTFVLSKGKIPEVFLRGCGLSDWEIEEVKLYDPDLSNDEVNKILYRVYELRASQALQISSLFISYSHADSKFVDKMGDYLTEKGIRYWRDDKDMKAGRMEKQIDRAIRQNPTVLLVLSEHSLRSDWVEHEVRTTRELEKEMGRDVLCPVALDDSWKSNPWPKRLMEQIMEYNILDFSAWKDDSEFEGMFRKLIDGLELFYKG